MPTYMVLRRVPIRREKAPRSILVTSSQTYEEEQMAMHNEQAGVAPKAARGSRCRPEHARWCSRESCRSSIRNDRRWDFEPSRR